MRIPLVTLAIVLALTFSATADHHARRTVTHIDAAKVKTAFEKGMPLIEVENYKVHASHREGPGMAEVHERDTDIVYMLAGSATLVTGGQVTDGQATATEEMRGSSIRGGRVQRLVPGDVIIIPNGVPHWFKDVSGPIDYYVVKVRSAH